MFLHSPRSAPQECGSRGTVPRYMALVAVASCLLVFNACSSASFPAASGAPSGTNSLPRLTISALVPRAVIGSPYRATLAVRGGIAPYVFSLSSGQLPEGVFLSSETGALSGTPTTTGDFSFSILVSDSSRLSKEQPLQIAVANTTVKQEKSFSNLQQRQGWTGYGQGPPDFVDCSPSPCDGISYSMNHGIKSPSMSGAATQYNLSGTAVYSDALFNNHLIGSFSSQGLPDDDHTLVPSYHTFTYDVYFYGADLQLAQAVEFDINQFFDNLGFIWGHECRIAGGHEWDIWDNVGQRWVPTGVSCHPTNNTWNHLTIQVQRTSSNELLYKSITLNGVTSMLNQYYNPGPAVDWYGVTINYQMDGNYLQSPYSILLDNLTFTYD